MPLTLSPERGSSKATGRKSDNSARQILVVLAVWLVVSLFLALLALPNLSSPGLYYDEAVNGGLAKDFVTGVVRGDTCPARRPYGYSAIHFRCLFSGIPAP